MKKTILSLAIVASTLAVATPASAQYYGRDDRNQEDRYDRSDRDGRYDRDDRYGRGDGGGERFQRNGPLGQALDRINIQIARGLQRGRLSPGEARRLKGEHDNLWRVAQRYYASNGLNGWERNDLQRRVSWLQQRLRAERQDDDRRYYR